MKTIADQFLIISFSVICSASVVFSQVFEEHLVGDSLGWIQDITAFDLDLDGDMDVLGSEGWEYFGNLNLHWWENRGEGEFERHTLVSNFMMIQGVTPLDFDNDGDIDILLAGVEDQNMFAVLENSGDLDFELHTIDANFDQNAVPYEIKAADLGGDARLDLVVGFSYPFGMDHFWGGLKVYFQIDPYTFRDTTLVDWGDAGWQSLSLMDFNGDGDLDIIATDQYRWRNDFEFQFGWWDNNDGNFEYHPLPLVGNATVKMIDLNQDGLVDILRFGTADDDNDDWTNIFWLENIGDLEFERHNIPGNPQMGVGSIAVADYDLDEDLDLIVSGRIALMENNGEEDFESRYIDQIPLFYPKVEAADINGDGRMDIVASTLGFINGYPTGEIYWFENRIEQAVPFIEERNVPSDFALVSVHPNPFNSIAVIPFQLPRQEQVNLSIYDITGRIVTEVFAGSMNEGYHRVVWNASEFTTGIYFCRMDAGTYSKTIKLALVK